MKVELRKAAGEIHFVVTDLDPAFHAAAQTVGYEMTETGLVRKFPSNALHVERAFANVPRHLETLLSQRAGMQPMPWQERMLTLLRIVEGQSLDWAVVGSAALALRGLDVMPGDIDLVTAEEDALKLGELALDYLIEPIQETPGWIGKWWARSFMGACVEWVGGVNDSADAYGISDFGPVAMTRLETIQWCGYTVRVPPLDLQLAVNERRGRDATAAVIRKALAVS